MKRNMGTADRIVRAAIVAPLAIIVGIVAGAGSVLGIILFVVAGIMLVTAAAGSCPLYRLVGLSTCPLDRRGGPAAQG
jgi:hypothetical protein